MVFLFLACHDQYFIMFRDSNIFEFSNFPFKTEHDNTIFFSISSKYLFSRVKKKKNVETIIWLKLLWLSLKRRFGGADTESADATDLADSVFIYYYLLLLFIYLFIYLFIIALFKVGVQT